MMHDVPACPGDELAGGRRGDGPQADDVDHKELQETLGHAAGLNRGQWAQEDARDERSTEEKDGADDVEQQKGAHAHVALQM